jgi:hypothetical protein
MNHELVLCRVLLQRLKDEFSHVLNSVIEKDLTRAQEAVHNYTLMAEYERVKENITGILHLVCSISPDIHSSSCYSIHTLFPVAVNLDFHK